MTRRFPTPAVLAVFFATRFGRAARVWCASAGALGAAALGLAHPMPMSGVLLDFQADRIDAELRLPVDRLEIAFGAPIVTRVSDAPVVPQDAELRAYLLEHIRPLSPDGIRWRVEIDALRFEAGAPDGTLVAFATLTPPSGAPVRRLTLGYDAIAHEIVTHAVVVAARLDWAGGKATSDPETLGIIRNQVKAVAIDRGPGSAWRGFRAMAALGARHIAEGTDHLLFLLALLLPAPLLACAGRWARHDSVGGGLRRVVALVTAFSLGHSLTLLAGAAGWMRLPAQPVEIAIACSVFVSALHAMRPIFAGREALVAGAFGLVHGLGFASALAEFRFDAAQLAWSLAGFNLGIEAVQLAAIAITLPWLVVLARSRVYPALRVGGALFAAAAALGWMAARALDLANPFAGLVEALARHAVWLLAGLVFLAARHALRTRRARARLRSSPSNP